VPGVMLSVVRENEVIFQEVFGVSDIETKVKADKDTLFYIASVTKAFTALSIAFLVDDGLLEWDRSICEYIDSFQTANDYITKNATIRDLLSHRTGIAEFPILGDAMVSRAELFKRMKDYPPNKPFGSSYQYSNSMYAIAGYIVELLTGMPWEEFVTKRIFTPLEMEHSDFAFCYEWDHPNRSKLYYKNDGVICKYPKSDKTTYDTWGPAGSINANSYDMSNWLSFLTCSGEFKGKRILSKENFDALMTPQVVAWKHEPDFSTACYCMGWVSQWYKGERVLWHNGSLGSYVSLLPDKQLGIAVLANMDSGLGRKLSCRLYDLLLNK
jgi:CubicO group peptidase (beta-lactamase class C family)